MSVSLEFSDRVLSGFDAEWQRIELLARCLLENRSSDKTSPDLILKLEAVNRLVIQHRQGDSPWDRPVFHGLDDLALGRRMNFIVLSGTAQTGPCRALSTPAPSLSLPSRRVMQPLPGGPALSPHEECQR